MMFKKNKRTELIIRWVKKRRDMIAVLVNMYSDLWPIIGHHQCGEFNAPHEATKKLGKARTLIDEALALIENEPEYPPTDDT